MPTVSLSRVSPLLLWLSIEALSVWLMWFCRSTKWGSTPCGIHRPNSSASPTSNIYYSDKWTSLTFINISTFQPRRCSRAQRSRALQTYLVSQNSSTHISALRSHGRRYTIQLPIFPWVRIENILVALCGKLQHMDLPWSVHYLGVFVCKLVHAWRGTRWASLALEAPVGNHASMEVCHCTERDRGHLLGRIRRLWRRVVLPVSEFPQCLEIK